MFHKQAITRPSAHQVLTRQTVLEYGLLVAAIAVAVVAVLQAMNVVG